MEELLLGLLLAGDELHVVHQQHVKAVLHDQLARQVNQTLVRLVGGDEHHGALLCCIRHMYSFIRLQALPSGQMPKDAHSIPPPPQKVNNGLPFPRRTACIPPA